VELFYEEISNLKGDKSAYLEGVLEIVERIIATTQIFGHSG
jgi:hypothetical protein